MTRVVTEAAVRGRRRRQHRAGLAAAAALVVLAGSTGTLLLTRDSTTPVPTERVALVAREPGLVVRSAELVPHTWGLEVTVVLTGLHPGERYRAVVVDRQGRPSPSGEFLGVGDRAAVCDLQSALLRAEARGFLLLDAAGSTVAEAALPA